MEQKKKMNLKIIILIIIAVAVSVPVIKYLVEQIRNDKYITSVTQQFNEKVKALENCTDTSGYISSIEATVKRQSLGEDGASWIDWVYLDVELTNMFRNLPEQERCTFIIKYEKDFEVLLDEIKKECGYYELEKSSEGFRYAGKVYSLSQYTVPSFHDDCLSYERHGDTFEIEGKVKYTNIHEKYNFKYKDGAVIEFEEKKPTSYYVPKLTVPSKKYSHSSGSNNSNSSKSSSSGSKPSDPYDADTYDDPDDFATDWEDEFGSYDEAYDYWEDAIN